MKELTRAEEQVMQVLWKLEKAFVKDILKELPSPKPAYNTVSTIVRILEKKEIVGHEAFGKSHQYYPLITREQFKGFTFRNFMNNYFSGSKEKFMSFFLNEEKMSVQELDEVLKFIDEHQKDSNIK